MLLPSFRRGNLHSFKKSERPLQVKDLGVNKASPCPPTVYTPEWERLRLVRELYSDGVIEVTLEHRLG